MENSGKKFVSDLFDRSNTVIIMQPAITAGMRKFGDLSRIHGNFHSPDYERLVFEVMRSIDCRAPSLVHTGNITTRQAGLRGFYEHAESCEFEYCGGFCSSDIDEVNFSERMEWHCDNCRTRIYTYHLKISDIPTILLHLLIKQMVPNLRVANYIWTEETGVVGILHEKLSYRPDLPHITESWKASLGFTLMPGMQTLASPTGFEEWLRYLVQIKFDQLQVMAESQLPQLIGPKHAGHRSGNLRFWRE